jgi:hypothetical protein
MPNVFKPNDIVKTITGSRVNGVVKYIACDMATMAKGQACNKKVCPHPNKDVCWVKWTTQANLLTYHYKDLAFDVSSAPTATAPIAPTPTVNITDDKKEEKDKADYLDKSKTAIKDMVAEKSKTIPQDEFFRRYYGFSIIRYDRLGKPYIRNEEHATKEPIKSEDVKFDEYYGIVRSPARKVGL